jgi:hypothetical protein
MIADGNQHRRFSSRLRLLKSGGAGGMVYGDLRQTAAEDRAPNPQEQVKAPGTARCVKTEVYGRYSPAFQPDGVTIHLRGATGAVSRPDARRHFTGSRASRQEWPDSRAAGAAEPRHS